MLGIRGRRFGAIAVATMMTAAACGGGGDDASEDVVLRTQGDIAIDADDIAETTTTVAETVDAPAGAADGESADDTADTTTSTTLPQEEQSSGEALFEAVGVFQSCLAADGYEFIGIPDASLGDVPQNQQPYIDALIACAARSQIQERLAEADAAQADLTPEEVEEQNRLYVAFRDCMIGRGWDIPEPTPNDVGLLFPGFAATTQWVAPPGEDITSSDDVGECTSDAGIELGEDL